MQVKIINRTPHNQFVDLDGDSENHDTTLALGPRAITQAEVSSERQFLALSKKFKNAITFKKL